ncbi:MAG: hypothetical protein J6S96_00540 [Muribaculaceae bacterium]|nr:hypothetical protein [Muribaculaceae bacterium]
MRRLLILAAIATISAASLAQEQTDKKINFSGSIHSEILIPQEDEKIGSEKPDDKVLTNTYANLALSSRYVDAGARFEFTKYPLPGFENDFKGWGVPNFWVKGKLNHVELTLGTNYEQFGSGFILRAYEQRSLGVDNSILGARAVVRFDGITVKAITGRQRRYWDWNKAWLTGADVELGLEQWINPLKQSNSHLMLGLSWVNKHESQEDLMVDATHKLNFPTYVNAWDARTQFQKGPFSILLEYAHKSQDPSFDNGYIYRPGHVEMLSMSYSQKGFSALVQAKRSENMMFRSRRSMSGVSSMINHLPAFTLEHTYALPALYPYATNANGEWAYQAELSYLFKKGTKLGGKYGTKLRLNFSHIQSLDNVDAPEPDKGSDGKEATFWGWGKNTYYRDINLQFEKKLSRKVKLNLMYMNQFYNKTCIEGEGGTIHSNIVVADVSYYISRKLTLRGEAQYLATHDDQGDWLYGLLELSVSPHWMFTVADMYNSGDTGIHYYQGLVTYNVKSHRLQVGYGRTRAGYNCSGGVCRYVPASRGVTVVYNYNF